MCPGNLEYGECSGSVRSKSWQERVALFSGQVSSFDTFMFGNVHGLWLQLLDGKITFTRTATEKKKLHGVFLHPVFRCMRSHDHSQSFRSPL